MCSHTFLFILQLTNLVKDRYIWQDSMLKVAILGKEILKYWRWKTE